eukprot:2097876-Rhodomonas_salina.4
MQRALSKDWVQRGGREGTNRAGGWRDEGDFVLALAGLLNRYDLQERDRETERQRSRETRESE